MDPSDNTSEDRSPEPASTTPRERSTCQKCIVLIGGTYNIFVCLGVLVSVNILYVDILNDFQRTRRETSFVQTTFIGMTFAAGLIAGIIIRRLGVKVSIISGASLSFLGLFLGWWATSVPYLIVTVGVIAGFGNSLSYISSVVFIANTFTERRSLALAIAMAGGAGAGQITIPLLLEQLLAAFGWRGCLLVTSGLFLNIIVSAVLTTSSLGADLSFRVKKQDSQDKDTKTGRWRDLLKPLFFLFVVTTTVSLGIVGNIVVLFMDYLDSQGYTLKAGVNVFIGFNILNCVASFIAGALNQNKHIHSLVLFCLFSLLLGCCLLSLRAAQSFITNVVLLCLMGAASGGLVGLVNIAPLDLCGLEIVAIAIGITSMSSGVFTPVIGMLIGWVFDSSGSYSFAFDVCGYATTGSAVLTLLAFCVSKCCAHRRKVTLKINSAQK